jgi:(1->4)-alpha-D-glucan 1-alpha-D-glucosylmutase
MGQLLLKLTVPGVADIYQGDELVSLSLVDPDNRREVDWDQRRTMLAQLRAGEIGPETSRDAEKLALVTRALALRKERPASFAGRYEPLEAGPYVCAFVRGGDVLVVAVMRSDGLDATVDVPWLGERRVGDLTEGRSYAILPR